jgi:Pyrimidine dimer DNA glycosylase
MQTYLPYPDFVKSAEVLDTKRLGKQIKDCVTILDTLHEVSDLHLYNNPLVRMWKFYEYRLSQFGLTCCQEWYERNEIDHELLPKIHQHETWAEGETTEYPIWWGDVDLHLQYRRLLIGENSGFYQPMWPRLKPLKKFRYP